MAKYIDAEKAEQVLSDLYSRLIGSRDHVSGLMSQSVSVGINLVAAIPAADVEPVVHAHWFLRGGLFRCSHCDAKAAWERKGGTGGFSWEFEQSKAPYCPSCGARMDETT